MLTILHGDNQITSRNRLITLIQEVKQRGQLVVTLVADKLESPQLEEALASQDLFGQEKLIVIEKLHSQPTGKRKKALIQLLVDTSKSPSSPAIILWEKRPLTKTMLKKFPNAQVEEFKVSKQLWKFLDTLGNRNMPLDKQLDLLEKSCQQEDPHFVYLMIARQVRLLIQAKEGYFSGAPFMISKLKRQASSFSLEKLLRLHRQLFEIDKQLKTSANLLDLKSLLDLFLISLYN